MSSGIWEFYINARIELILNLQKEICKKLGIDADSIIKEHDKKLVETRQQMQVITKGPWDQ